MGVGFSVILMSISFGVSDRITGDLGAQGVRDAGLLDVDLIESILRELTVAVTLAMIIQTAAATAIVGWVLMQSRKREIGIRRQSGVFRSRLLRDFLTEMSGPVLGGAIGGEAAGVLIASAIRRFTVLPVAFTPVSLLAAFPVTIVLAGIATTIPAWAAANQSPKSMQAGR
jgi:ABC-type antimicrobial peptide transport system permease subunit